MPLEFRPEFHALCGPGSCASRTRRLIMFRQIILTPVLRLICFAACVLLWSSEPQVLFAGGEYTRGSDTVRLTVDSRWPGNSHGGYVPLRIKLTNLGPEQDFQLTFSRNASGSFDRAPEVRRTVHLDQNATRDFTLPIPMVSVANSGELKVFDGRGREIEELRTSHTLPQFGGENARASILVISADDIDDKALEPFENAAATECAAVKGLLTTGGRHGSGQIAESDHLVVPPVNLPESWVDYSGVELIAISWTDLNSKLRSLERDALLRWASCGGILIIYQTEKPAAELTELHQLLKLDSSAGKLWLPVEVPIIETTITTAKSFNMGVTTSRRGMPGVALGTTPGPPETEPGQSDDGAVNHWITDGNAPTYRDYALGRIYAFPKKPFPGTAPDWAWLLVSMPQNQTRWSARLGLSSRVAGTDFLNFLIPGVGSVPVHAFLILITIFTVVIGPLNYYWLRKQRRLGALVFTVPAIASIACIMLFFYSLVADGFSIRSRVHSVTFLDQQAKSASSISRLCLYAPFAPSTGLKFSSNVAAFPIWPQQQHFENGVVDWTGNEQRLTSGWFRSQTFTQFLTIDQRDERGRLDITPPASADAQELTVSNGLSWDLEYLAVEPITGVWFVGEKIPAGASAQLKRETAENISMQFSKLSKSQQWDLPEGVRDPSTLMGYGGMYGRGGYPGAYPGGYYGYGRGGYYAGSQQLYDGQLKRYQNGTSMIQTSPAIQHVEWRNGNLRNATSRHSDTARPHYWGVCGKNPGVELGVQNSIDQGSFHLIFGVL